MKLTDSLREEHEVIKQMLDVIEIIIKKLETGSVIDFNDLEQIINFITIFTDKCHHGKEEDILFVAIEEAGIPKEGGPVGVMLQEHDMGRFYVRNMRESIEQLERGNQAYIQKFVENARNYTGLLRNHIYKENNVLYPLAEMHISEEKQQQIIKEYEKLETERIGTGTHEKMHTLVMQLKDKYTNNQ
ncbi:MAG: hemerythrin domain-containing protein [Dehalococcoidales bacterium]|jgi:hemerythrin-like domain-containing protein|nr:hemerythrin domain-containing protein [Dehalococcoidales bacterium]